MSAKDTRSFALTFLFMLLILICSADVSASANTMTIVSPQQATLAEHLAAKEVRRYLYLRIGKLLPIVQCNKQLPSGVDFIIVGQKNSDIVKALIDKEAALRLSVDSLQPQQYRLKTVSYVKQKAVLITGADPIATLYAAYRFAEHLGVRFYLHGDTIPDAGITLALPQLDELGKPLFGLRGIQPFHDFPEGPDWWNTDDYKAIIAQLPKLRMNFIGLHTYPEGSVGPEPTVWIGMENDVGPDGKIKFSYRSSYQNTLRGNWGYAPKKTSEFNFGASQLFQRDDYGAKVMFGMIPWPKSPEENNKVFNRVADMLKEAFEYAHALGVKTCVGTETPLTIPKDVKLRIKATGKNPSNPALVQQVYEGMFQRIMRAYPLDFYWLWTPEGWLWHGTKDKHVAATQKDLLLAFAAAKKVRAPFTLATAGWVLGPAKNPAQFDAVLPKEMPFSCINREVGKAPVEPKFAEIEGRPKWAIPWLEDDPRMIQPQLWVGRMRKDAADALKYGCTGLMGIHWRTRLLGPNVLALARAAWDQNLLKKAQQFESDLQVKVIDGKIGRYPTNPVADTNDDPLYQTVAWHMSCYRLKLPNGKYNVKLQFCEHAFNETGKRIFDVKLQGKTVIEKLDIFAKVGKTKALDYTFNNIEVTNGRLDIDFVHFNDFACIAAIAVQGQAATVKINCGGTAYKDYAADPVERQRFLPTDDFYKDWALHQFGPQAADQVAAIFTRIDGILHEPCQWLHGPGGILTNPVPWSQVKAHYTFVDELAELQPKIKGPGNRARFDYWLNSFRFMKAMAQVGCTLGDLIETMKLIDDEDHTELKTRLARDIALPLRKQLVQQWGQMADYLLQTVSNSGEMGTVANIEQHSMNRLQLLTRHDYVLTELLGASLPPDTRPWKEYRGPDRVIVPTVRTSLMSGESLKLKVIILSANQPTDAVLYWRPMGGKTKYNKISLGLIARGVCSVTILAEEINNSDLEYYVKVTVSGQPIYFPATAPQINQTLIIMDQPDSNTKSAPRTG